MFQLDPKWRETDETLFQKSISTENKRLRERYPALALIASGKPIQSVARQIHRRHQTVSDRERVSHVTPSGFNGFFLLFPIIITSLRD